MIGRVKQVLLRGDTDKKVFAQISEDITEANRKSLTLYAIVATIGMAGMTLITFFSEELAENRPVYAAIALVCALLGLASSLCRKEHPLPVYICVYAFMAILYAFGIAMGTLVNPDIISVSFPVLLFAVPMFFTDIPLRMIIASLLSILCYCLLARQTQSEWIYVNNLLSILPYGAASIVLSSFMMCIKVHRYALDYENKFLIESDQLTGMLNRRCYEQHLQLLRGGEIPAGMTVCAFDINGLKMVNDNLGHYAGDELIRGAADCIEGVCGKYGRCYRTGGDEFMALLEGTGLPVEELKEKLILRCSCFKGSYVSGLSISVGIIRAMGGENIDELVRQADQLMYDDKKHFYESAGRDRRKS